MNGKFILFAQPWWVNLVFVIPFLAYLLWRKRELELTKRQLIFAALFAISFGFIEASVVIYLRAAIGLLPGYNGSLSDIARFSSNIYQQTDVLKSLPNALSIIEVLREVATMIMLLAIALIAAPKRRERFALFLWSFAFWDLFYYVWLWTIVRWPSSLTTPDVLFLIPAPWLSQIWFPLLINALVIASVILCARPQKETN
ncbi:MAG: hypothetical protein V1845_01575 [bacterium]